MHQPKLLLAVQSCRQNISKWPGMVVVRTPHPPNVGSFQTLSTFHRAHGLGLGLVKPLLHRLDCLSRPRSCAPLATRPRVSRWFQGGSGGLTSNPLLQFQPEVHMEFEPVKDAAHPSRILPIVGKRAAETHKQTLRTNPLPRGREWSVKRESSWR
jgi:hypothetical protein